MATLTFTNNLGTISLTNAMYSISHKYNWSKESGVVPKFSIAVNATMHKDAADMCNIAPYEAGKASQEGRTGTLTLPHQTYPGMVIRNMSYENGIWSPYGKVSMEFDDDNSDASLSRYMIHWWGINVYNPKISINPSKLRRAEASVFGIDGWFRQLAGYGMTTMNIEGMIEASTQPVAFVDTLEKTYTGASSGDPYRSGYPLVYNLVDAMPEAAGDNNIDFRNVMVTGGGARWHFEKHYADVFITLLIPPQKIEP